MGIKNPIGKIIHLWGEDREIIGVAKNFNFQSLYENMKPAFFDFSFNQRASKIAVRIKAGQEKETIGRLEKLYKADNQGLAFEYRFLDDDYQALYASEKRVAALSQYFAVLTIIISCLGLFGLAAFTAQRRQKEIGIRKVVGASVRQVVMLLSRDFLQLIVIAVMIALPAVLVGDEPVAAWVCLSHPRRHGCILGSRRLHPSDHVTDHRLSIHPGSRG